jgi:hypothetical protein
MIEQNDIPISNGIARGRTERAFFATIALAMFAAVFLGFQDSYFRAGLFFAHLPNVMVHIHGALFVGWVLLLLVQIALVACGHRRWHRRLGIVGAVIAPLMVLSAGFTLVLALRRNAVPRIPPPVFFAGDLLQLMIFAGFVLAALRMRNRSPDAHKRLMLFATIAILAPAIDRWDFPFMSSIVATIAVLSVFPLSIAAYDLLATRRLHRATGAGLLVYVLMIALIFLLPAMPLWQQFTAWVAR